MKQKFLLQALVAFVGAAMLGITPAAQADSKKYQDLQKKLLIDRGETDAPGMGSYAPALEKVMPAVVTIFASKSVKVQRTTNSQQEEMLKRFFDIPDELLEQYKNEAPERQQQGLGSGVVISPDGYILTNNHVVSDADEIKVTLPENQKEYAAELIGGDPRTDVALLKIDAKGLKQITIGDSSKLRIGDVVLAVGNPLTLEQSASMGIVSALGRNELNITNGGYENFIQTDAAINRGNSGGALVDASGRLIGINTAIQSNFSGGNIGIGFAIPANMALNIVERLIEGDGVVKRGFLGVYLRELDENFAKALGRDEQNGVLVTEVGRATPAAEAGMKPGDLIVAYNGSEVSNMQRLRLDISNTAPGAAVKFDVIRNGKDKSIEVVLGDLEDGTKSLAGAPGPNRTAKPQEFVEGVRIKDLDEETRSALQLDEDIMGVVVESVQDNAPAAKAGLRPGTVITQIDQKDIESVTEAFDLVESFESDVLLLQVYVAGRRDILAVPLTE